MLVLKRNVGEDILIGTGIVVRLLESGDGHAKLGVTAPKEVPIHRREVADAIKAQTIVAAIQPDGDGCPLTTGELPPVIAMTDAFDHTQFDDMYVERDLSKLGITFRPTQPR